jgi:hypothetical protein
MTARPMKLRSMKLSGSEFSPMVAQRFNGEGG